jgi:hypothetical protein
MLQSKLDEIKMMNHQPHYYYFCTEYVEHMKERILQVACFWVCACMLSFI